MDQPQVTWELLEDLKPHPRNYRQHPEDQLAHIVESIRKHGFYRNIVVARDGTILAGHGVSLAARKMGLEKVPVIRLDLSPDDPLALKVLTGDNEIGRLAETDDRMLASLLEEIRTSDPIGKLAGTGFTEEQLSALVEQSFSSAANVDPPGEFKQFDESLETHFKCPKCSFEWSGRQS